MTMPSLCDLTIDQMRELLRSVGESPPNHLGEESLRYFIISRMEQNKLFHAIPNDTAEGMFAKLQAGTRLLIGDVEYLKATSGIEHAESLLVDLKTGRACRPSEKIFWYRRASSQFTVISEP